MIFESMCKSWIYFMIFVFMLETVNSNFLLFLGLKQSVLQNFEIQDPAHLIQSMTAASAVLCMRYCIDHQQCSSFSVNANTKACLLYDVIYASTEKGIISSNTTHYNIGENSKCPMLNGYTHFRQTDGCYKILPDQGAAFTDAQITCENDGGYLVKFDDVTEKTAMTSLLSASEGYKKGYWTGAFKDGPGDTWAWRDGTPVPVSDMFRPGEPSGFGTCAYHSLGENGFNDFPCASWPRILCERDMPNN